MQRVKFISELPEEYPVILRPEFNQWYFSKKIWWWEPHPWGTFDIFTLVDKDILKKDLLEQKAFLIVDFSIDAPYIDYIESSHLRTILHFFKENSISLSQLIVLSPTTNELYFTDSMGYKVKRPYKHLFFNPFWFNSKRNFLRKNYKLPEKNILKPYFCLMRVDTAPRRLVNYMLHFSELHKKGFVSHNRIMDNSNNQSDREKLSKSVETYKSKKHFNKSLFKDFAFLRHFLDDNRSESFSYSITNMDLNLKLSSETFLELVVESQEIDRLFFTEKLMKAIFNKNIFLVFNSPRSLEYLNRLGFKTFSHLFDESYDTIDDDYDRLLAMIDQLRDFSSLPNDKLQDIYKNNLYILEHNQEHLLSNDWSFNLHNRIERYLNAV